MHILIIGGAGFVGMSIAEALLARGDSVTLFDTREPYAALPGNPATIVGDVRRDEDVSRAFASRPDVVIYGAAITAVAARDAAAPQRVIDVNLGGLPRVMDAARAAGVKRFILLSSASTFGDAAFREAPLAEDDPPPAPSSLYSITKFAGEGVARRLGALWSIDVRMVRCRLCSGRGASHRARDTLSPPFQVAQLARSRKPIVLPRDTPRGWVYSAMSPARCWRWTTRRARARPLSRRPGHHLEAVGMGGCAGRSCRGRRRTQCRPVRRSRPRDAGDRPADRRSRLPSAVPSAAACAADYRAWLATEG